MKIVYEKTPEGRAINLRFEKDDYQLKQNEIEYGRGDKLPDIEELHDPAFKLKRQKEEELEKYRSQYSLLLEEFVDILFAKGIISPSDLSQQAQNIIFRKKQLEQELNT